MTTTTTDTGSFLRLYADDIAFVAEKSPATTLGDFVDQLDTAATRLGRFAGINGAEDLEDAVRYLNDAQDATDETTRTVLLNQAHDLLKDTGDIVQEYRLMV